MLPAGSTIGILGGGQLGRMLALAAAPLGYHVVVFSCETDSPAAEVSSKHLQKDYLDEDALADFARCCDVITYEFENIPLECVRYLEAKCPVFPSSSALAVAQDRLIEKQTFSQLGIPVAPFRKVDSYEELQEAIDGVGCPSILKTRRFGYDGKGQVAIAAEDDCLAAWNEISEAPAILEARIDFDFELSVIMARDKVGNCRFFDCARNVHRNYILHTSAVPAKIEPVMEEAATRYAYDLASSLEYVGVLAVEFFASGQSLVANECAPRVHNSGHWTMDACQVSQFEQHIRAIAGMPLVEPMRHHDVIMENLIGKDISKADQLASDSGIAIHHYGKKETRAGRKMGHINRLCAPASSKSV